MTVISIQSDDDPEGEYLMITSMTGYGKGSAPVGGGKIDVEIRTVNHRFLDFSIRVPRPLNGHEGDIEKAIRKKVRRGHVYVNVNFDKGAESTTSAVNRKLLRKTYKELTAFAKKEGIPGQLEIGTLLMLPDMFRPEIDTIPPAKLKAALKKALVEAVGRLADMRNREGKTLQADMQKRLADISRVAARIQKKAPKALEQTLARARKRLQNLMGKTEVRDERWAIEAAALADRTDFSEELVRLKSHLVEFGSVLGKGGEISKKLTFLLQEIHREATTMGNKSADPTVIRDCLAIKEQVEKIREQVQNLE
jgi:uncharacterized protein (TIGR00255 family)